MHISSLIKRNWGSHSNFQTVFKNQANPISSPTSDRLKAPMLFTNFPDNEPHDI